MRLKTKLVLAITALVFFISGTLALIYVSHLLHLAVEQSYDTNHMVAEQVRFAVQNALEEGLRDRTVNPNDPAQLRNLTTTAVRDNAALQTVIKSANRYATTVYDINIADNQSNILLSTNPDNEDRPLPQRPNYASLLQANPIQLIREVSGEPRVFDIAVMLDRNSQSFVSVHVGVRTTFLRAVYAPWLDKAFTFMVFALVAALIVAFLLSNFALRPMEEISHRLDYWTADENTLVAGNMAARQDTAERVSTKIEIIGQRMRSVQEVFSALKENVDQVLGNLQDGLLLFTADGRAVLASEAVHRFLALDRGHIVGLQTHDIFDCNTALGKTLRDAYDARTHLIQKEIQIENGKRVKVSLDFIYDNESHHGLGALVTLHDLESAEQIESELELSRRMAAIGRLTSGVGHEVKNPINAIVVHLELLKNKLSSSDAPAAKHLSIIDAEIHRLDRVVQMLVDFSRPVDLHLYEQDLRLVVSDVLALSSVELTTHNVTMASHIPGTPLMVNIDTDLMKQAALNVIQNGAQSMPEGGRLSVSLKEDHKYAILSIADEGAGIPDEIREKIFDLYFTTKNGGSGIGLAMTYRILQLHNGSIEVQSKKGHGTEFILRIPLVATESGRKNSPAV